MENTPNKDNHWLTVVKPETLEKARDWVKSEYTGATYGKQEFDRWVCGRLGEMFIAHLFKTTVNVGAGADGGTDVRVGNTSVDVKTLQRTVECRSHYEGNVDKASVDRVVPSMLASKIYVLCSYDYVGKTIQLMGYESGDFITQRKYYRAQNHKRKQTGGGWHTATMNCFELPYFSLKQEDSIEEYIEAIGHFKH